MSRTALFLSCCTLLLAACQAAPPARPNEQQVFWQSLQALCGSAFPGRVVEDSTADPRFQDPAMVMHVRECSAQQVRIPFHVGSDRSRTWVLSHTETGLRLKHDLRHESSPGSASPTPCGAKGRLAASAWSST